MENKTIYIFGNPLLDFDNLPIKFAPKLREAFPDINFVIADPNENLKPVDKELIIIDTVENIEKVVLIDDIAKLETQKLYSLHDFDLAFNLKLLQKIGELKKVTIIGVPMREDEERTLKELIKIMRSHNHLTRKKCEAQLMQGS